MPRCSRWCNASQTSPIVMFRFFFFPCAILCIFAATPRRCCQVNGFFIFPLCRCAPCVLLHHLRQRNAASARLIFLFPPCAPAQFTRFCHHLRNLHVAASCAAMQQRSSQVDCCLCFLPLCRCVACTRQKPLPPGWLWHSAAAARLIVDAAPPPTAYLIVIVFFLCRFTVCVFWPLSFIVPWCSLCVAALRAATNRCCSQVDFFLFFPCAAAQLASDKSHRQVDCFCFLFSPWWIVILFFQPRSICTALRRCTAALPPHLHCCCCLCHHCHLRLIITFSFFGSRFHSALPWWCCTAVLPSFLHSRCCRRRDWYLFAATSTLRCTLPQRCRMAVAATPPVMLPSPPPPVQYYLRFGIVIQCRHFCRVDRCPCCCWCRWGVAFPSHPIPVLPFPCHRHPCCHPCCHSPSPSWPGDCRIFNVVPCCNLLSVQIVISVTILAVIDSL